MTRHTIDEGLSRFALISGMGNGTDTACAMSLLNWIWQNDDKGWNDSPECAHPLIRSVVIHVNDAADTTADMRAQIVRAGEHGILDTWWVPSEVVVWALSHDRDAHSPSPFDRLTTALGRIAAWKASRERVNLVGAYLVGAYLVGAYLVGANLTDANLVGANLIGAYLARANLARANLARANLAGADLAGADLAGANLARANLAGADLAGANLARAKGNAYTTLPVGWKVNDAGLIVRAES